MTNEPKTTAGVVRVCPECDIAGCRHLRAAPPTAQAAPAAAAPSDVAAYLNVADQCAATATSELARQVLVDGGSGLLRELLNDAADAIRWAVALAAAPQPQAPAQEGHSYSSTQATNCAQCGQHKHTPLRIDAMGGYVCLTCIDQTLGSLLGEFGYEGAPAQEPSPTAGMTLAQRILHVGGRNNAAGYVEFGSTQAVDALVRQVLRDLPQAPAAQGDALLRRLFDAGWKAAARYCGRDDVVADGIIGFGACPQFEAEFATALAAQAKETP